MRLLQCLTVFLACLTLSDAGKRKKKPALVSVTIAEKCEKWVGKFDQCLSMGFQPRHFKTCQETFGELVGKDKKWCKKVEMRIKKRCSYTCQPMIMPGGQYEVSVTDEDVVRVADVVVTELKNRAVSQGTLDENSTIVKGDIVKVMKQVVAGERFMITIKLGVTDKSECKEAAKDSIVSFVDCSHEDNMGTYKISVVHAPWRTPQYQFEGFEDVEGPEMKDKYWETDTKNIS